MANEVVVYILEQIKYRDKVCVPIANIDESIIKDVVLKLVDETLIVEVEKSNDMYLLMVERKPLLVK